MILGNHLSKAHYSGSQARSSSLEQAIDSAESGSFHLAAAHNSSLDSYRTLDGYQPSANDIARDTPYRDVSPSAQALHAKAEDATAKAQSADNSQYSAQDFLHFALSSLEEALPQLPPQQKSKAIEARQLLSQDQNLWYANVYLGNALASINGGAVPYIEAAERDAPGKDVSWTGGEIYGNLHDSLSYLKMAKDTNGSSLDEVRQAVSILKSLG